MFKRRLDRVEAIGRNSLNGDAGHSTPRLKILDFTCVSRFWGVRGRRHRLTEPLPCACARKTDARVGYPDPTGGPVEATWESLPYLSVTCGYAGQRDEGSLLPVAGVLQRRVPPRGAVSRRITERQL